MLSVVAMLSLVDHQKPWISMRMVDTREQDKLDRQRAGAALKILRKRSGLTQEAAADAAGISVQSWRNYERGDRLMDNTLIIKATRALGSSAEEHALEVTRITGPDRSERSFSPTDDRRPMSLPVGGIAYGGAMRPNLYDDDHSSEVIDFSRFFSPGTRVLRLDGMSMYPYAEPGGFVTYNPRQPARRGYGCVIEMKDGSYAVKRFERMDSLNLIVTELYPVEQELTIPLADVVGAYAIGLRSD